MTNRRCAWSCLVLFGQISCFPWGRVTDWYTHTHTHTHLYKSINNVFWMSCKCDKCLPWLWFTPSDSTDTDGVSWPVPCQPLIPWQMGQIILVALPWIKCWHPYQVKSIILVMTSSNGPIFRAAGNSSVTGEFPSQRPVTRSFDVFYDLRVNKRLSKQSWGWWFEAPSRSLWRHRNV